ncbi:MULTISPECIES: TadE family protein [Streptacidiphilus]|uniref:TadE family protein n=2 Tax=Streptacidiphilus TaxID=228398 RepID=A0ABV6UUI4_9ACTN|nr:TadE family protein [Streptacidiphilus jeojiense]
MKRRLRTGPASREDAGSMSISLALVFPSVLVLILLTVQGALWWYDRQVALTAAREGSEAQRLFQADPAAGETQANSFLDRVGGGLTDRNVTVTESDTTVTSTVTVRTQSLLPFLPGILITQTITAPVERFVPATAQ